MSTQAILEKTLRANNKSITITRIRVFQALAESEPQTISEIIQKLHNSVDRASVYRTIELYEKLGIVQRLQIGWKYRLELTETFHHHHHHLTCIKCNVIVVVKDINSLENKLKNVAKKAQFKLTSHQIELQGLCSKCQNLRPQLYS